MEATDAMLHIRIMIISFSFGIMIAFIFDFGRFFLKSINLNNIVTSIFELCFWVVAALISFNIYLVNFWGEIRFYNLLAIFIGYCFYKIVFYKRVVNILLSIRRLVVYISSYTLNIFISPFLWIKRKLNNI
ncbi:MAG TPA: hypothetical protein GX526_01970 [Thermoanaerobacterales bacterium]|nr:hypothetical protein [Thermoanaerobacterales bacterium]